MSRKAVALVILSYFVAALAFGAFLELQEPFASFNLSSPVFVGGAVGSAGAVFTLSAIIPLIVWAFGRFRAQRAGGPLVLWAILGVITATFSGVEHCARNEGVAHCWITSGNEFQLILGRPPADWSLDSPMRENRSK
jgi:hypothetical protein